MLEPVEVARREEHRQAVSVSEIAGDSEPFAGGWMSFGGADSWANQASGCGLDGPVSEAELDRLVAFYDERGVAGEVEVAPYAHESLVQGLNARGFAIKHFETVLAAGGGSLARGVEGERGRSAMERLPHGMPEGVEIRRVEPVDEEFDRAFARFGMGQFVPGGVEAVSEGQIAVSMRAHRHPRNVSFVALDLMRDAASDAERIVGVAGVEVAMGAAAPHGPVACLYGTGVAQGFRRRGIQQALIAARLDVCAEMGCPVVCIHSQPSWGPGIPTERNAMRLGFGVMYTKVVVGRTEQR